MQTNKSKKQIIELKGRKVLVAGLGISGFEAAKLLAQKGAIVKVTEASSCDDVKKYLEGLSSFSSIEFEFGAHTEDFCKRVDLVVTSPGLDLDSLPLALARREQIPIIGELELGFLFCGAPIVAITGTNGKSTTTELIGRILSSSGRHTVICGNIGNPLSGEVNSLTPESVAVVEVSSFQLETIKEFRPHVAVILNVSEDHYERHGDYDNYKKEKFKIFKNQSEDDWAILHPDFRNDPMTKEIKSQLSFFDTKDIDIKKEDMMLKGTHNLDNIACSIMVSRIMGAGDHHIQEGIKTFKDLDHRFEKIEGFGGIEFIDDSKATNIDATRRAIESTDGRVVLIAGGRDKGGDYSSITSLIKKKVKTMVLIGEAAGRIKDTFSGAVPVVAALNMAEAVQTAIASADEGEIVMLSPMCSSFDMYSSYKERGEVFQREVRKAGNVSSRHSGCVAIKPTLDTV